MPAESELQETTSRQTERGNFSPRSPENINKASSKTMFYKILKINSKNVGNKKDKIKKPWNMSKQACKVDPCPVKTPSLLLQLSAFFTEKNTFHYSKC